MNTKRKILTANDMTAGLMALVLTGFVAGQLGVAAAEPATGSGKTTCNTQGQGVSDSTSSACKSAATQGGKPGPGMMPKMMGKMGSGGQMGSMCAAMMSGAGGRSGMMRQCQQMMGKMGMPDEMMLRMEAMMETPIFLDSPGALYGQRERLQLTKAQTQRLTEIENKARKQALAVLTPEQRETLGALPKTPMAMMKMCQQMRKKMLPMMESMNQQARKEKVTEDGQNPSCDSSKAGKSQ